MNPPRTTGRNLQAYFPGLRVRRRTPHVESLRTTVVGRGGFSNLDTQAFEVRHSVFDRRRPDKAQISAAGCDRRPRVRFAVDTRTVDVQLVRPEAVRVPGADAHRLRTENSRVELVRSLPITDGDDAVIKRTSYPASTP